MAEGIFGNSYVETCGRNAFAKTRPGLAACGSPGRTDDLQILTRPNQMSRYIVQSPMKL